MNHRRTKFLSSLAVFAAVVCVALVAFSALAPEALARVGGGQSYGGGSSSGGGGGGAGLIIWLILRLILLTIEYPVIGIPLDIIIIVGIILYSRSNKGKAPSVCSTDAAVGTTSPTYRSYTQEFNQLRRFDPNFSEITFTDFCYALYARAQHSRTHGKLDELSPYLSEAARKSLYERNPPDLREVAGIIIGSMNIAGVQ